MNKQVGLEILDTNPVRGFEFGMVGPVPFTRPLGVALRGDQVEALGSAAKMVEMGRVNVAAAIVGHIQRELGVTQELHIEAIQAGESVLEGRMMRSRIAARILQRRRAEELSKASATPALSDVVALNLAAADDARIELARARSERIRGGVRAALNEIRKYESRAAEVRARQVDEAWIDRAGRETLQLAEDRGEDWGFTNDPNVERAVRMKSRDGLRTLFESGSLSIAQYDAAKVHRAGWELSGRGLKIANYEGGGGRQSTAQVYFGRTKAEVQRGEAIGKMVQIERSMPDEETRTLLRQVAGEGMTLSAIFRSGHARTKALARLKDALNLAVEALKKSPCESQAVS